MQNGHNHMKRYCNLFFLLVPLLFASNTAKSAGSRISFDTCHLNISQDVSCASPGTSMNEKKPHAEYLVMFFRAGIEGKSILFSFKANIHSLHIGNRFNENILTNAVRVKYILSFSGFFVLPPEFLCAFSSHAPPVLC